MNNKIKIGDTKYLLSEAITFNEAPTLHTVGYVGQLYVHRNNNDIGDLYLCVYVFGNNYLWTRINIAPDQTYSATSTNAQSGVAVASAIQSAIGNIETALSGI